MAFFEVKRMMFRILIVIFKVEIMLLLQDSNLVIIVYVNRKWHNVNGFKTVLTWICLQVTSQCIFYCQWRNFKLFWSHECNYYNIIELCMKVHKFDFRRFYEVSIIRIAKSLIKYRNVNERERLTLFYTNYCAV